jgi:hypothetical protein
MWARSSARAAITMPHPESSNRNPPNFMIRFDLFAGSPKLLSTHDTTWEIG